uniref:Glutaredoxin n=1 Tax=Rhizophora mucronata TaxID=61149 RepID=A0A2P2J0W9_RHIMU
MSCDTLSVAISLSFRSS